jgi:hypothetical protein
MWWWILPLAPDVPERLVVGHERTFLTWFYDRHMARREAISALGAMAGTPGRSQWVVCLS